MSYSSQASFPRRVNIIHGGKYALVKADWWDCPAKVIAASEVLKSDSTRSYCGYKWKIQADENYDQQGRPLCCKIRNDCHPQRSLRASAPVMIDNEVWTAEHNWLMEYVEGAECVGSVSAAFHLCSLKSYPERAYLTVDEESGELVMQQAKPSMVWEFYDSVATRTQMPPGTTLSLASTCDSLDNPTDEYHLQPSVEPIAAQVEDLAEKLLGIKPFLGEVEHAFQAHHKTCDGKREFTPLTHMVAVGTPLGDELTICSDSSTLFGLAVSLFGKESNFRKQLAAGKGAEVSCIKALHGAAWCGVGTSRFKITVPVLGERPFEEDLRLALAAVDGENVSLAVQVSSKIALGFPVGDFLTEAVHIFTQNAAGGPVFLKSFGLAAPGRHQEKAIAGMRESRQFFCDLVRSTVSGSSSEMLELKLTLGMSDFAVSVDPRPLDAADSYLADVEVCSSSAIEPANCDARASNKPWSAWNALQTCFGPR